MDLEDMATHFERLSIPEPMSGCLLWLGAVDQKGYGLFNRKGKKLRATHVALQLVGRPLPPGMLACHHCDTPQCVNHDHLFAGTHTDNAADMVFKGRHNFSGLLLRGMPRRFSKEDILRDYIAGEKLTVIAAKYGCSKSYPPFIARQCGVPRRHPKFNPKPKLNLPPVVE